MKDKLLLSLCLFFLATFSFAQQGIVVSGGNATGSDGSASYSIGQIDYNSASGTGNYIIEGLQQPFEISEINGIEEKGISLLSSVYPNPSQGNLVLKIENDNFDGFTYKVCDELGKVLIHRRIEGQETIISLSNYGNAKYFIKVINKEEELKTFQLVKLN